MFAHLVGQVNYFSTKGRNIKCKTTIYVIQCLWKRSEKWVAMIRRRVEYFLEKNVINRSNNFPSKLFHAAVHRSDHVMGISIKNRYHWFDIDSANASQYKLSAEFSKCYFERWWPQEKSRKRSKIESTET